MFQSNFFWLGCLGAFAPEIVRLFNLRIRASQFKWSPFYLIVSIMFCFLGGVISYYLPSTSSIGAIYSGIATPLIVSNAGKHLPDNKPEGEYVGFVGGGKSGISWIPPEEETEEEMLLRTRKVGLRNFFKAI